MDLNRFLLTGRLVRDCELRYTQSNKAVANFVLAVGRRTNNNGEQETDFLDCVVWNKQAENLSRYTSKGSKVAVDGRLQKRSYQANDGSTRYVVEIVCESITFLDSKPQTDNTNQQVQTRQNSQQYGYNQQQPNNEIYQPQYQSSNQQVIESFNQQQDKTILSNEDFANFGKNMDAKEDDEPFGNYQDDLSDLPF